jgi:hypothetical protein
MTDVNRRRLTAATLVTAAAALLPRAVIGAVAGNTQIVDGVVVYYGVIPGEILLDHPMQNPDKDMHGGVPAGGHVYHLLVAIFDASTGQRISNAEVSAQFEESHQATPRKKLDPMPVSDGMSYGNFFDLPGTGPYRIAVWVRLPGRQQAIEAVFDYQHARV